MGSTKIMKYKIDAGSFRDPKGQVLLYKNKVLRTVTKVGAMDYDFVKNSSIYQGLVHKGFVIEAKEVDVPEVHSEDVVYVLEHPKIPFISYPYEWSFHALKKAALLHLTIQIEALSHDIILSDASAYNIQFLGAKPIFIDIHSFSKYTEGDYWTAHSQFCEQFLNPLLLRSLSGVAHNAWYRGSQEGIPTQELAKILPLKKCFSWRVFSQVILQNYFQKAAQGKKKNLGKKLQKISFPKSSYMGMLVSLKKWIEKLVPIEEATSVWGNYNNENSYDPMAYEKKVSFIHNFVSSVKPHQLWDFGCNNGHYGTIALKAGANEVIGFDVDQNALSEAFVKADEEDMHLLPLYFDAANQSPDQGWRSKERMGLINRKSADAIMNLAFAHHMIISKNIPMDQYVDWLFSFASQGIVEFVPKNDPMVQELLSLREDIFPNYTKENFIRLIKERADIVDMQTVTKSGRILIWYRVVDK